MFISFDIETGGDDCRIVQLSLEYFILGTDGDSDGSKRLENTIDSFVKPHQSEIWSKHAT